ncbi:MAG: glycosyltransferase family 2 protein [Candidatus Paceibacterota bacterium]
MNNSFVSIVVACRNEEKLIGKCLGSIAEQDYQKDKIEVLVVDGISEDKSREIINDYSEKFPYIRILDNPKKFTNFAFNIGIRESKGEIITLMGAHAIYEKDYVSKCVKYLKEYDADNVGGVLKTVPAEDTLVAKSIAYCFSSFFGTGGSYFRIGSKKPRWVDTVFGGCYKREVFNKIGFFNEKLSKSQDFEFNLRLKKSGGKILLAPDIVAYYYPKSNLEDFLRHNFEDGVWAILPFKFVKAPFNLRHYIPLLFILTFLLTFIFGIFFFPARIIFDLIFGSYLMLNLFFSIGIAFRRGFRYLFIMPIVFIYRHFGYGMGSLLGFIKMLK